MFIHACPLFENGTYRGSLKTFTDVSRLKEFETRYRYFADQTEEGFYRLQAKDPVPVDLLGEEQVRRILESFVLVEANEAWARAYGFSRSQELLPRTLRDLYPCWDIPRELHEMLLDFVVNGYRLTGREVRVVLPDGRECWLPYTAVGLLEGGRLQAIWGTQRDITARKKAKEALAQEIHRLTVLHRVSQELLAVQAQEEIFSAGHRAVAELMPAEAFVIPLKRSEEEAEAVYLYDKGGRFPPACIPRGQGLTWYVLERGRSVHIRDLGAEKIPAIHFGTEESVRSVLAVPLRVGERTIGILSTQSYRPNAFTEKDLGILELLAAYIAVAIENAQLLQGLRESEARFRRLAEHAPDIIYHYRLKPKPSFEYVSPAATRITGYTPEEHYADPDLGMKIVHPQDQPLLATLPQEEGFFEKPLELRWLRKDGRLIWTEQINVPIYDEEGDLVAIEGIVRDITERKRAEEEQAAWARKVEGLFYQVVDAFASAMDLREPYTGGNQRRVAELALAIAEEMGLPAERVRGLRVAALLHDVGKALFVPIEILSKPGKLTDLEMALIREHPQAGYEILKRVEFPWPVAEIVYQHHERLDGPGYPRGLREDEILLEARILAVADVVEAMSSHRPYRPALGVEAALAEIREKAGKLCDPAVVRSARTCPPKSSSSRACPFRFHVHGDRGPAV